MNPAELFLPKLRAAAPEVAPEGGLLVAKPRGEAELDALLAAARPLGLPVAVGEGRLGSGLLLDLAALASVDVDAESLLVRAGAGVRLGALEDELLSRGFTLGAPPGDLAAHTVGGAVASRSYLRLGRTFAAWEDPLVSVEAVLPDGGRYRSTPAPRRATGPDLMRLIAGAEGAFGIVVAAELRIFRLYGAAAEAAWRFPTFAEAAWGARRLLAAGTSPSVLYAAEEAGAATLAARWDGTARGVAEARRGFAAELLGAPGAEAGPLLRRRAERRVEPSRPAAEALLPYREVERALASLGASRGPAKSRAFLPDAVIVYVDDEPLAPDLYKAALDAGGLPAPASPLYELGSLFGPLMLGGAYQSMIAAKAALDPELLFAPGALGLSPPA
jgi:FAD/FMN-containing dehydrogenase